MIFMCIFQELMGLGRQCRAALQWRPAMARYVLAPNSAPTIGATQSAHSCSMAQPPTKRATPVLRAGSTDVLVTGMLIS